MNWTLFRPLRPHPHPRWITLKPQRPSTTPSVSTCSGNARFFPPRPDHSAGILSQLGSVPVVPSSGLNSRGCTVSAHAGDGVHNKQTPRLVTAKAKVKTSLSDSSPVHCYRREAHNKPFSVFPGGFEPPLTVSCQRRCPFSFRNCGEEGRPTANN